MIRLYHNYYYVGSLVAFGSGRSVRRGSVSQRLNAADLQAGLCRLTEAASGSFISCADLHLLC